MNHPRGLVALLALVGILTLGTSPAAAAPDDQLTWGLHFSPTPAWFDPAETSGGPTQYVLLFALHDAMVRPRPGHATAPSLAESWSVSADGLVYEFVLRKGVRFHNGDLVTA